MFENNVLSSRSRTHFRDDQDMLFSSTLIIITLVLSACFSENHLYQAIRYSEASIVAEDGATIAKHSNTAITHALSVHDQEYISSAAKIHLSLAIVSLEQAIEESVNYEENDLARKAARLAIEVVSCNCTT